jgi:hypothetical protein
MNRVPPSNGRLHHGGRIARPGGASESSCVFMDIIIIVAFMPYFYSPGSLRLKHGRIDGSRRVCQIQARSAAVRGKAIGCDVLMSDAGMLCPAHIQSGGGKGKRPCGESVGPRTRRTEYPVDDAGRRVNPTVTNLADMRSRRPPPMPAPRATRATRALPTRRGSMKPAVTSRYDSDHYDAI